MAIQPISENSAVAVSRAEALQASLPLEPGTDFPEAERIAEAARTLRDRLAATPEPALARLARVCGLDWMDVRIVAVLLAPEIDPELERGYCYALDDFTKKRPDLRFISRMIGASDDAVIDRVLTRFDDGAPLRRFSCR